MNRRKFLFGGIGLSSLAIMRTVTDYEREDETIIRKSMISKSLDEGRMLASLRPVRKHHSLKKYPKFKYRKPTSVVMTDFDHAILVKTIWGETRGESRIGRMAVVHVILNRIHSNNPLYKSYKTISEVCLRKFQFSCWLDKLMMRHIKVDDTFHQIKKDVDDAIRAYEHGIDYSNGAVLYYSDRFSPPAWASAYEQVNKIGHHNFFA